MIGLGVLNNQPANSYQAPLVDGIHLRWGFLRELGFPWYGFYLFRRPAQSGQPLCLSNVTGGLKKGSWPDNKLYTALGVLSSDVNLVLTDEFTPANQVEFNLAGRQYLRFDLPEGESSRRVELRVGLRAERCLDFQKLHPAPNPTPISVVNPTIVQGVSLTVKDAASNLLTNSTLYPVNTQNGPLLGLGCGYGLTVNLPTPCNAVDLLMTIWEPVVPVHTTYTFEAFDAGNNKVATKHVNVLASPPNIILPAGRAMPIDLAGPNITRIEVSSVRNAIYLHRLCGDNLNVGAGEVLVNGTAFSGATPIRTFTVAGQPGQIISTSIENDAITAIEIRTCDGSLIDLCYVPVAQDATQGWQKLSATVLAPGITYPIGLPVLQADYPCSVPNPQTLLTQRVRYALPPEWTPATFAELHDQLVELVKGGPSTTPMDDRIFDAPPAVSNPPDPNPPKLSTFYILDLLLLGSLYPALAQLLGMYWVDQTAVPDVAYDYLIVADHTGVGQRDVATVLATIQSSGFEQLDGYILFNQSLSTTADLDAPVGLHTYELPGGTFPNAQGQLPQWSNNAGLLWDVGWDDTGSLLPGHAVMYLVWRADLGNAATPAPAGSHDLVTKIPPDKAKPILVTEPRIPNGLVPERSPDWPPVPLHFIDRNLPDGWYSYEVSGVDLFGRHSPNSAPAQILLRDKIPPPMPAAVKADALDPDDPYLQKDDAYNEWFSSLDPIARETLIGLRVGWRWTPAHQQQAPDASEFRIYFHPGPVLPLDRDQATNWQERYYVVGYDENFTIDPDSGDRLYEIFLPPPTDPLLTSVPLNPSLAEPVAYAHIGVSAADDKTHTADHRTTGGWSNRPGNEGFVGPVAKIYRVWRTPPPAPGDVFAGERLYASPADYHNQSFFTYRWQPQPLLNLHVLRAMDDAIFKADWSQRPSAPPLDESQLDLFPAGWNQATRQSVAAALNQLNTFVGVEGGTAQAMAYYRQLSDGALRVLAGLPSSENAFVQLTINPLKPNDPANNNRLGPDNPDDLVLDPTQSAFIDTLDGRSTNCYFYRAAFVDDAHNLGPLGLSSPPVYLPKVFPQNTPVVTKIRGGERQIELRWVRSREADLSAYRVYRTSDAANTRDIRKMDQLNDLPVDTIDPNQNEVTWIDQAVPAGIDFHYRVTALDSETLPNESAPSKVVMGRAVDTQPPVAPELISAEWVLYDEAANNEHPWPEAEEIAASLVPVIKIVVQGAGTIQVSRRNDSELAWHVVGHVTDQADHPVSFFDFAADPNLITNYRVNGINDANLTSPFSVSRQVAARAGTQLSPTDEENENG